MCNQHTRGLVPHIIKSFFALEGDGCLITWMLIIGCLEKFSIQFLVLLPYKNHD